MTEVKPAQGFAAETSTAAAILASSHLGFALSTTQVASGSVIGSGLGRAGAGIKWGLFGKMALGWLFTLPAAAVVGAVAALIAHLGTTGLVIDFCLGVVVVAAIFVISRRNKQIEAAADVGAAAALVHRPKVQMTKAQRRVQDKAVAKAVAKERAKAKAKAKTKARQREADALAMKHNTPGERR